MHFVVGNGDVDIVAFVVVVVVVAAVVGVLVVAIFVGLALV